MTTDRGTEQQTGAESRTFVGRYRVLETLHVGQNSDVFVVEALLRSSRELICKRVAGRSPESAPVKRLESEYRLLSSLRHPSLPRVRDFARDLAGDATLMVCDRAPGAPLDSLAPLALDDAVAMAVDVCRALSLLHSRAWLHLDVKPKNVLWDQVSRRATLVDLDLAAFPESPARDALLGAAAFTVARDR